MLIRNAVTRQQSYDLHYRQWILCSLNSIDPLHSVAIANAIGWASRKASSDTPWQLADPKPP